MAAGHGVDRVARVENFARAGYAARGVVYILLGYFALTTAGGGNGGTTGVLRQIQEMPLGTILLVLVGLGLAGWGLYRLYGAAVDIQGKGSDAKGLGTRGGHALSGIAHLVLCFVALRLAFGDGGGGGTGGGAQKAQAAATAEQLPMGDTLIVLIGIGFGLAALQQLVKAATASFMELLDPRAPDLTEWIGRAGYAARAVVFAALAWQILQVALGGGSAREAGIGGALNALRETGWLYMLVAIGLILFGIFSLVMARYRRIRDENVIRRLKQKAA